MPPQGVLKIQGLIREPPRAGLLLGEELFEQLAESSYRLQRLDIDWIAEFTRLDFLPYIIHLNADEPHGFAREWRMPGSGRERHLGYAFQWFALAATLLVIYLVVNLKRITKSPDSDTSANRE